MRKMPEKAKVPAIRFKNFTDAWEQRKLGDEVQIIMGQSPDGSTYTDIPSDYILVQGNADLKNGWVMPRVWTSQVTKKAEAGDLIMSVRAPAGEMGKTAYNAVIGRGVAAIKGNEFIFQSLVKMNFEGYWKRLSCGSTFESLNSDNIKNAEIMIPHLKEQLQIGLFFDNLDNLITLHQRKLLKLKNVKKAMLEKMFPKNGSNVPEIRFAGFTDAWEQRKLGNIVERIVRKNTNNESTLPLTISALYGLVDQITYFNNRVASRDVSNYYLVMNGEFAYNKSTSDGFPFGAVKRLDLYENGVLSTLYIVFSIRDCEETNSDFLAVFFGTDRWHKGVSERAAEGARNHGLLNISADDFLDIGLFIPRETDEQKQIGTYFKNLDNLITLHQRKYEKLQNLKKACLEKMFV